MKIEFVARAGGVESAISSDWDEDAALKREVRWAHAKILIELIKAGSIKVSPKYRDGDYLKQTVTLEWP